MNWETKEYKVKQLVTGEALTVRVHTIKGDEAGPHIHIQASVHGAEIQGNAVILQLMQKLQDFSLKGSISFVPICNPYATATKNGTYTYGRFNPVTGHNWNRNFFDLIEKHERKDFETFVDEYKNQSWPEIKTAYKSFLQEKLKNLRDQMIAEDSLHDNININILLQSLAAKADGILDMHTGPSATRYLYSAEFQKKIAQMLLFKHVLVIPNEFAGAMDEACFMPWIHLQNELAKHGKEVELDVEAFTLEFGSEETFSMDWAQKDVESVLNYLSYKGVIKRDLKEHRPNYCLLKNYKTLYAPRGGLVDYRFAPGDHFKQGDVLASFYCFDQLNPAKPIESTRHDVTAKQDGIIINRCPSSAVHQGMELYQVMTEVE